MPGFSECILKRAGSLTTLADNNRRCDMDLARTLEGFKNWEERRSRHMIPAAAFRAGLIRNLLVFALFALAGEAALLSWDGTSAQWLRFMIVQPAIWLVIAAAAYLKGGAASARSTLIARAFLFTAIVEMATLPTVRSHYPQYGGVMVLTIILAGLFVSGWYVFAWTMTICVVQISQIPFSDWTWASYAGWCAVYIAAGWLVTLFAKHLERFYEASKLAEEQQRSAIVDERTRFARDMHDTLAQGFTGIMMQLNAAEQRLAHNADEARMHIDKARRLARESFDEAQRCVSALRNVALANGTLLSAIEQIGHKLTSDSNVRLEAKLEGQPYSLPEHCESNLLRIAQEALTNAVRHAGAATIRVFLAYRPGAVVLEVDDSGQGMSSGRSFGGGFGIQGMRERARQIGGEIQILSNPGGGTRVIVTVPNA
jgi:signal transduction histidine kinase